jgi:ATP-binding cassette subfamily B protein
VGRAARLVVDQLGYRYPGAQRDALTGINTTIPVGISVALVGTNGSGKTTFLDLILGLRRPTTGTIGWLDTTGHPTAPRAAATFQDYARYETTLYDNIAFGDWTNAQTDDPNTHDTDPALTHALTQVELGHLLDTLPQRTHTQLGTRWAHSHGLSGGQWQRLAIARCLYPSLRTPHTNPNAPQIRVLDEASSSLDAAAEERLRSVILGAALPGDGLTIYVTHRFPIIRSANLILVFHQGRLVEQGDHQTLHAQNGVYTALFEAQARGY